MSSPVDALRTACSKAGMVHSVVVLDVDDARELLRDLEASPDPQPYTLEDEARLLEAREEAEQMGALLEDADEAVLSSRCAEEEMRVECEGYRNTELQEQVGDLAWQFAQAVQREGEMRDELLRLRDIVCEEDAASIDRVIGEPAECDYPECEKCGERDHCEDCCHEPATTDGCPF